jgi:hypothetical protein
MVIESKPAMQVAKPRYYFITAYPFDILDMVKTCI